MVAGEAPRVREARGGGRLGVRTRGTSLQAGEGEVLPDAAILPGGGLFWHSVFPPSGLPGRLRRLDVALLAGALVPLAGGPRNRAAEAVEVRPPAANGGAVECGTSSFGEPGALGARRFCLSANHVTICHYATWNIQTAHGRPPENPVRHGTRRRGGHCRREFSGGDAGAAARPAAGARWRRGAAGPPAAVSAGQRLLRAGDADGADRRRPCQGDAHAVHLGGVPVRAG